MSGNDRYLQGLNAAIEILRFLKASSDATASVSVAACHWYSLSFKLADGKKPAGKSGALNQL